VGFAGHGLLAGRGRRRIEAREETVGAWIALDWEQVASEQRRVEAIARSRRGPLWGLPVGIKDIFDTADLPTGYGSVQRGGVGPDSTVVVVGCGPVGLMAVLCAVGVAKRVIAMRDGMLVETTDEALAVATAKGGPHA